MARTQTAILALALLALLATAAATEATQEATTDSGDFLKGMLTRGMAACDLNSATAGLGTSLYRARPHVERRGRCGRLYHSQVWS